MSERIGLGARARRRLRRQRESIAVVHDINDTAGTIADIRRSTEPFWRSQVVTVDEAPNWAELIAQRDAQEALQEYELDTTQIYTTFPRYYTTAAAPNRINFTHPNWSNGWRVVYENGWGYVEPQYPEEMRVPDGL